MINVPRSYCVPSRCQTNIVVHIENDSTESVAGFFGTTGEIRKRAQHARQFNTDTLVELRVRRARVKPIRSSRHSTSVAFLPSRVRYSFVNRPVFTFRHFCFVFIVRGYINDDVYNNNVHA